jgi:hypothetical protein
MTCEYLEHSDEGTSYCRLANKTAKDFEKLNNLYCPECNTLFPPKKSFDVSCPNNCGNTLVGYLYFMEKNTEKLEKKNAVMREALEFYAAENHWDDECCHSPTKKRLKQIEFCEPDAAKTAQEALSQCDEIDKGEG